MSDITFDTCTCGSVVVSSAKAVADLKADNDRLRAALSADAQTLRLHLGEMTSQEMRTLKAGLKWVLSCAELEGK